MQLTASRLGGGAGTFAAAADVLTEATFFTPGAIGFIYSPTAVVWVRRTSSGWVTREGEYSDSGLAFELRIFDGERELRWRKEGREGVGLVLDERPASGQLGERRRLSEAPYQRLVWGSTTGRVSDDGLWAEIAEGSRIAPFWVPIDASQVAQSTRSSVALSAIEYVRRDEFGNLGVVDERLVGLAVT